MNNNDFDFKLVSKSQLIDYFNRLNAQHQLYITVKGNGIHKLNYNDIVEIINNIPSTRILFVED